MALKKIIFDSPIYSKWRNEGKGIGAYKEDSLNKRISDFDERVELFCVKCKTRRIFSPDSGVYIDTIKIHNTQFPTETIRNKLSLFKTFRCSSSTDHQIFYGFLVDGGDIIKIAEYPSKFDTVSDRFNKYKNIFKAEKLKELAKAAQLESHGYAIAAFLYYRRIFEDIVLQTFSNATIKNKLPEKEYRKQRMKDKIKYVENFLPEYFNENSHIYGILSKGVHELQEKECQHYLPVVKAIIFYSLDEAVDERNQKLRKKEFARELNDINSKFK